MLQLAVLPPVFIHAAGPTQDTHQLLQKVEAKFGCSLRDQMEEVAVELSAVDEKQ